MTAFMERRSDREARAGVNAVKRRRHAALMAPARYSLMYLTGTIVLFLMSNLARDVENMFLLLFFVIASYAGLYLGFRLGALSSATPFRNTHPFEFGRRRWEPWLILAGSIYFTVWGINQISEFGGTSVVGVVRSILSPGEAYRIKFEIFQARVEAGRVSPVTQILVILSILYAMLVPLCVVSWARMPVWLRLIFVSSAAIYIASFLFIGTMKGIGDVFLYTLTGFGVLLAKKTLGSGVGPSPRKARAIIALLAVALFAYMASNQIDRAEEFGITEAGIVGDVSETFIARTFGDNVAYGVYTVLAYPSHGYLGLSYNLQQPFEFSYGAGFSQALESYRYQFLGGEDFRYRTYPYRTEAATGWPAGMYWSTIFPWLASDLSFFLIPPFMALIGFVFARVWIACVFGRSVLALAALGQLVIFVAFLPANNQVLMQRQGLWVVITLLGLWVFNKIRPRTAYRHA